MTMHSPARPSTICHAETVATDTAFSRRHLIRIPDPFSHPNASCSANGSDGCCKQVSVVQIRLRSPWNAQTDAEAVS